REQPALLAAMARCSVYDPSRPAAEHKVAKAQLITALRQHPAPRPVEYLEALAAAHYRLGEGKYALEALRTSEGVMKERLGPVSLAFLAMTHKRLGDGAKAKSYLDRARKAAPAPRREAELAPGLKLLAVLEEAGRVVGAKDE